MASGLSILLPKIKIGTFPMVSSVINACGSGEDKHKRSQTLLLLNGLVMAFNLHNNLKRPFKLKVRIVVIALDEF